MIRNTNQHMTIKEIAMRIDTIRTLKVVCHDKLHACHIIAFLVFLLIAFSAPSHSAPDGPPAPETDNSDKWADWEEGEIEDPFEGSMHTAMMDFIDTSAQLGDSNITFRLGIFMRSYDTKEKAVCTKARVYVTANLGKTWSIVDMSNTAFDEEQHRETWEGSIPLSEANPEDGTPVVYFFRAEDNFGNVTTELPDTSPGWPPTPDAFFPGAGDVDNNDEIVPDAVDLLQQWVARDGQHIYFAQVHQGRISPGPEDPNPLNNIYALKFTNLKEHPYEGIVAGRMLEFAPMISYPSSRLVDIEALMLGESPGRIMDGCASFAAAPLREFILALGDNVMYTRTRIHAACPTGCNVIRTIAMNLATDPAQEFFLSYNCSHFLTIYLRAHVLGNPEAEPPTVRGPSLARNLAEPSIHFPGLMPEGTDISPENIQRIETSSFHRWLDSFENSSFSPPRMTVSHDYQGPGPFTITPCDIIRYNNHHMEAYTRNGRLKLRIFRQGKLLHTIMIGEDTIPLRDEQHDTGDIYVTLSGFTQNPMSCTVEIRDSKTE